MLDPLELELEMIMNLHVGAGVLCKSQAISSDLKLLFVNCLTLLILYLGTVKKGPGFTLTLDLAARR